MKRSIILGLHLGFWFCYVVLTIALIGLYSESYERIPQETIFEDSLKKAFFFTFLPSIGSFYAFYFLVFRYLRQRNFVLSLFAGLGISLGGGLLSITLLTIFLGIESVSKAQESALVGVIFVSFICLLIGGAALLIKGFITWYEELKLKEELHQKNHEMEMALIKAQLDPHFLFNTLNNIDILIIKDATEASNYLNKLCDIMRFMLYETKADKVLLSKEIEYIEKYIALQKIRSTNPNYINFNLTGSTSGRTIAPMVFLPFIENAFKHTTNKKLDDAINIQIIIEKEQTKLICKNKFDPKRKLNEGSNGLGNELVERRLKLIYPDDHFLDVAKNQNQYTVILTIKH